MNTDHILKQVYEKFEGLQKNIALKISQALLGVNLRVMFTLVAS